MGLAIHPTCQEVVYIHTLPPGSGSAICRDRFQVFLMWLTSQVKILPFVQTLNLWLHFMQNSIIFVDALGISADRYELCWIFFPNFKKWSISKFSISLQTLFFKKYINYPKWEQSYSILLYKLFFHFRDSWQLLLLFHRSRVWLQGAHSLSVVDTHQI